MRGLFFIHLAILLVMFSFSSPAQDNSYQCDAEKQNIIEDLMKPVECVQDAECSYFDYGYPWQPEACMKGSVNNTKQAHNITNLELIEEYNNHCIYKNPEENKKFEDFSSKLETEKCDNMPRLYCYKGFCRVGSYAIYNDE